MGCAFYRQGKCLKQESVERIAGGGPLRPFSREIRTFADCQHSNDIWVGSMAVPGRIEDSHRRKEDCSMFEAVPD